MRPGLSRRGDIRQSSQAERRCGAFAMAVGAVVSYRFDRSSIVCSSSVVLVTAVAT
jgi:hypothetical protein